MSRSQLAGGRATALRVGRLADDGLPSLSTTLTHSSCAMLLGQL